MAGGPNSAAIAYLNTWRVLQPPVWSAPKSTTPVLLLLPYMHCLNIVTTSHRRCSSNPSPKNILNRDTAVENFKQALELDRICFTEGACTSTLNVSLCSEFKDNCQANVVLFPVKFPKICFCHYSSNSLQHILALSLSLLHSGCLVTESSNLSLPW